MKNIRNLSLVDYPLAGGIGMSAPVGGGVKFRGGAWTIAAPGALKPEGTTLSSAAAAALHVGRENQFAVDAQQIVRACTSVPVDRSP